MTKAKISEYDAVASNNTDVNGVNIAENCPPSGMNNMGREIMAALKRFQVGSDGDGVTVGGNLVVSGTSTVAALNTSGAVVFNDAGADVDFRVEGDTDANLLFVDAGNDRVGVKTSSPAVAFDVVGQVRASTGILFGSDTAAANALDDYEEGTWTPTIIGTSTAGTASYTAQVGNYTKIGRVVYIRFTVEYNSGTGTGSLRVSGLPFTVGADAYPLSIQADNLTLTASHYAQAVAVSTTTEVGIQSVAVGTNPSIGNVSYDASAFLRGAGFYFI